MRFIQKGGFYESCPRVYVTFFNRCICERSEFFEIIVSNQKQAMAFYSTALGWKFQDVGSPNFVLVTNAGVNGALLTASSEIVRGESVKIFFKSNQLEESLTKIKGAGGTIKLQPTDVGDGTWLAEFGDPDGNIIGLMCEGSNCAKHLEINED